MRKGWEILQPSLRTGVKVTGPKQLHSLLHPQMFFIKFSFLEAVGLFMGPSSHYWIFRFGFHFFFSLTSIYWASAKMPIDSDSAPPPPPAHSTPPENKNQDHRGVWDIAVLSAGWSSRFAVRKKGHQVSSWKPSSIIILSGALKAEVKSRIPAPPEGTAHSEPIPPTLLPAPH